MKIELSGRQLPCTTMEGSESDEFIGVEQRIRTLTTILQNMNVTHPPNREKGQIPSFLRHFATLLTCGDTHVGDSNKVVAVTGSITPTGIQSLVVTQSSCLSSSEPCLEVEYLARSNKTFEQVVNDWYVHIDTVSMIMMRIIFTVTIILV